jgi:hypothetical protein
MGVLDHFIQESFVAPARKKQLDDEAAKIKKTVPPKPPRTKKKALPTATKPNRHIEKANG